MNVQEIAEAVMGLSERDRLELARRIVDSVVGEQQSASEVARAVQGIEDVLTGKSCSNTPNSFKSARQRFSRSRSEEFKPT